MGIARRMAAALAALSIALPASAQAHEMGDAEKLRRLDIMLMVTGLRCRTTADNFQAEYGRFTTNHIGELNAANRVLKAELASLHGIGGADRALDRISVTMANQYGQGHPWLSCGQLRQVTRSLADAKGSGPLLAAADQLFGPPSGGQFAWARR